MEKAPIEKNYYIKGYENVTVGRVNWPMSTIRLSSSNKDEISKSC